MELSGTSLRTRWTPGPGAAEAAVLASLRADQVSLRAANSSPAATTWIDPRRTIIDERWSSISLRTRANSWLTLLPELADLLPQPLPELADFLSQLLLEEQQVALRRQRRAHLPLHCIDHRTRLLRRDGDADERIIQRDWEAHAGSKQMHSVAQEYAPRCRHLHDVSAETLSPALIDRDFFGGRSRPAAHPSRLRFTQLYTRAIVPKRGARTVRAVFVPPGDSHD